MCRVTHWPTAASGLQYEFETGEDMEGGYPWLAHDCLNYLVSCKTCNQDNKRTCFPVGGCSSHAQLLCLVVYFSDRGVARQTSATWAALSRACHHHPYELNPTADEMRAWLASARTFANEVARQTGSSTK